MTKPCKAGILGTGSCLPEKRLTNEDLERMVETDNEWIVKRTGIKERRIIDKDVPLAVLAAEAARKALEKSGLTIDAIDLIIATTVTPDALTPSLACSVQKHIGGKAAAFDLNGACSGFIYALNLAESLIRAGSYNHVLIVSAEALSRVTDYTDRASCILFGDGAGAVVVGRVEDGTGVESTLLGAEGEDGGVLTIPCFHLSEEDKAVRNEGKSQVIWMEGKEVFTFATRVMADATRYVLEKARKSVDQVKMIFPHQANIRILQNAAKRLNISMDSVYTNLENTGNISSASIPVCLDEASSKGLLHKGDNIVLVAFGGGLTYGATLLTWSY